MGFSVSYEVPRHGYGQYYSTTCWYASYRMLFSWKNADEDTIAPKLKKAGLALNELKKRGLLMNEYPTAAGALGLCGWRGSWVRTQSAGMIAHILKGYGPLWAALDWRGEPGAGHAVVVVAYDDESEVFKVHNPYNRFEPGFVEVDWLKPASLRNWIQDTRFALQAWY